MEIKKVGFLGMGVMGLPMVKNVIKKCGLPVLGFDVNEARLKEFQEAGGIAVEDATEIYKQCDVILQILPTHPIIIHSVEQAIEYGGKICISPTVIMMLVGVLIASWIATMSVPRVEPRMPTRTPAFTARPPMSWR